MSVTKNKTLAKVRTFAQDFEDHQDPKDTGEQLAVPKKGIASVVVTKSPKKKDSKKESDKTPVAIKEEHPDPKKKKEAPSIHESAKQFEKESKKIFSADQESSTPRIVKNSTIRVRQNPTKSPAKRSVTGPATVITATRKSPKGASQESFFDRLSKWFKALSTTNKKNKTPVYGVQDSVRRKGVIKKATTKTGAIFTADNDTLREEILRRRKNREHEIDVTWTPNTDPGYNLLDAPHKEILTSPALIKDTEPEQLPVVIEPNGYTRLETSPTEELEEKTNKEDYVAASQDIRWEKPVEALDEPVVDEVEEEPVQAPIPVAVPVALPKPIKVPVPESTPIAIPEPPQVQPVTQAEVASVTEAVQPTPAPKVEPFAALKQIVKGQTENLNTNAVAIGFVAVIAVIIIVVSSVQWLLGLLVSEVTLVAEVEVPSLLLDGNATLYTLPEISTESIDAVLENTDTIVVSAEEEIVFIDGSGQLVDPQSLVQLLGLRPGPNLNQSIQSIHLVVVDTIQNGLLLEVTDEFTALGGMLEWESRIAEDTEDILFPPDVPTASLRFVDETYLDIDMRIFTDGVDEIVVYGFVTDNLILITQSSDTFKRLAN